MAIVIADRIASRASADCNSSKARVRPEPVANITKRSSGSRSVKTSGSSMERTVDGSKPASPKAAEALYGSP
eukprot:scaffold11970_cov112-Isochrysis_galbana.AAC.3